MKAKGFNETMDGTTNLISNYINVGVAKKNFKDTVLNTDKIVDVKTDTKKQKTGGGGGGIDISDAGTIRSGDNDFKGDSGPTTQQEADYGYGSDAGFYARGGLASIL